MSSYISTLTGSDRSSTVFGIGRIEITDLGHCSLIKRLKIQFIK